jgi:hypothetical protein
MIEWTREDAGNGVLFSNRREKPSHPKCKGEATIEGNCYWVAHLGEEGGQKVLLDDVPPEGEAGQAEGGVLQ